MPRIILLACLILALVPAVAAPPPEAGKAVNRLQLQLAPAAETWYTVGDYITVPLMVRNDSDADIAFLLDPCCTFYDHVFMVNEQGEACKADQNRARLSHAGAQWLTIKAQSSQHLGETLNHWVVIDKPGVYTVWFVYEMAKPNQAWQKPSAAPFVGTLVSNLITVTVISAEEYAKRAGGAVADGTYAGMSVTLQSAKTAYAPSEALDFSVTLHNASAAPLQVPWEQYGRVIRRDDPLGADARERDWRNFTARSAIPTVTVPAHGDVTLPVPMSRAHIAQALTGVQHYWADIWTPAPAVVSNEGDVQPLPPVRTVSNAVTISIDVHEADVDRLLAAAVAEMAAGKMRRDQAPSLDTLCAYLPALAPWLSARAKGDGPTARLAADLLIARDARTLLANARQHAQLSVTAQDTFTLDPAELAALVGLTAAEKDAEHFAQGYVRLERSVQWLNAGLPTTIDAHPAAHDEAVLHLADAIMARAKAEGVYLYRCNVQLTNVPGGWPYLDIAEMSASMLLCVEGPMHERKTPQYDLLQLPQPADGSFAGWDGAGLRQALGGLRDAKDRFATPADLAAYLATQPKRHQQVWIIALPGATWADIDAAVVALQKWANPSLALAPEVPIQVWGE